MKNILVLVLLALVAAAQNTGPSTTSSSSIPTDVENARKAKAVIDAGIKALGGEAYLTWRTQSSEGRAYSFHHGEANSLGTIYWRFKEFPDKERIELTKKRDIVQLYTGDKGYEITYKGPRALEDKTELQPYLRRRHYSLDVVLRQWLNDPGVAFFYEGQTVAAQKQTDQVTIMNSRNEGVTLNFDVNTHLPVRKLFTWRDTTDNERNTEEEIYDNFRPIQGIMTPFDFTRSYNGDMASQLFLTSASYNQELSEDLFNPQAPAPDKKDKKHH